MINAVLFWRTHVILTNWLTNLLRDRVGWIPSRKGSASFQIFETASVFFRCSYQFLCMLIFIPLCKRFGCETFMKMFILLYIHSSLHVSLFNLVVWKRSQNLFRDSVGCWQVLHYSTLAEILLGIWLVARESQPIDKSWISKSKGHPMSWVYMMFIHVLMSFPLGNQHFRTWKWIVGRGSFPFWGPTPFSGAMFMNFSDQQFNWWGQHFDALETDLALHPVTFRSCWCFKWVVESM